MVVNEKIFENYFQVSGKNQYILWINNAVKISNFLWLLSCGCDIDGFCHIVTVFQKTEF